MAPPPDLKTLEAAATWYVQLNDGTPDEARTHAWQAWLQASPQHAAAWARVEALQQQWAKMPRQAALSGLGAAQKQRRAVLKILGMLLAVGGCSWLAVEQVPYRAVLAQHRTHTRERRSLKLDDGTQLELNTGTALDIRFDAHQRLIQLYQGEILVQTAKDPASARSSSAPATARSRRLAPSSAFANWKTAPTSVCWRPPLKSARAANQNRRCAWRPANRSRSITMRLKTRVLCLLARRHGFAAC